MKNNMNFTALPFDNDAQISRPRVAAEDDPRQWPTNRKMKWPLIVFLAAVLTLVTCVTVSLIRKAPEYSRAQVEVSFHGVKLSKDGEILEEGEIVISGTLGPEHFYVKQLSFAGKSIQKALSKCYLWNEHHTDRITFWLYRATAFDGDVEIGIEGDWCVISVDGVYIVGAPADSVDVKAIVARSYIVSKALRDALARKSVEIIE